jgi:hypothetical protein
MRVNDMVRAQTVGAGKAHSLGRYVGNRSLEGRIRLVFVSYRVEHGADN